MVYWTSYENRKSEQHMHNYDEYLVCVYGQYKINMNEKTISLNPVDELFIPSGVMHSGEAIAGTRTIHVFGGERAKRERE